MLSLLPGLTENEFGHGCQALQMRCDGRLDDTDWLRVRWQDGVLSIKKSYHIKSLENLAINTTSCESDQSATSLGEDNDGDDV